MNKIILDGKNTRLIESDGFLKLDVLDHEKSLEVTDIKIDIEKDTDLYIETSGKDEKDNIIINVYPKAKVNLYEFKTLGTHKFQYTYNMDKESEIHVEKVYDINSNNEMTIMNLNGEKSKIDYALKTVSESNEKYNFLVYHNGKNSISNIINNGVNILDGTLEFNVSGFVNRGVTGCDVNQDNRILNLTRNFCVIEPNLFIDEYDVVANHAAHIGTFSEDSIFYLMSRGIDQKTAENLLTKGFLLKGITKYTDELSEIINKYWR